MNTIQELFDLQIIVNDPNLPYFHVPAVIRSAFELSEFNRILANQKLVELAKKVDEVNLKQEKASMTTTGQDVFEI